MKLSLAQLQGYLRQAGWPENLIVTAAAVFYYESAGGETTAHKVDSIERSYGLAQINLGLPGTRLAAERAVYGPAERLYDPVYNLRIAYQLYRSQGWGAWENTYYGERYKQYMAASQAAYNSNAGGIQTVTQAPPQPNPVFSAPHNDNTYDYNNDNTSYPNPTYTDILMVDEQGNSVDAQNAPSNDYSGILVAAVAAGLAAWLLS